MSLYPSHDTFLGYGKNGFNLASRIRAFANIIKHHIILVHSPKYLPCMAAQAEFGTLVFRIRFIQSIVKWEPNNEMFGVLGLIAWAFNLSTKSSKPKKVIMESPYFLWMIATSIAHTPPCWIFLTTFDL